jgi:hypothetical protein
VLGRGLEEMSDLMCGWLWRACHLLCFVEVVLVVFEDSLDL